MMEMMHMMQMRNSFYFGQDIGHVLLKQWMVDSPTGLFGVCVVALILTLMESYIQALTRRLERELSKQATLQAHREAKYPRLDPSKVKDPTLKRALSIYMDPNRWVKYDADIFSTEKKTCHKSDTETNGQLTDGTKEQKDSRKRTTTNIERLKYHIALSSLHVVRLLLGYLVMLLVMNYNGWILLATVVGVGIGYFLFAWNAHEAYRLRAQEKKKPPVVV
ncbi:uncharacterized protein [Ptychodera flava]|uniref:uncharacterized protein n=1 Tax=Ptychodera flava TaxID=63121 RepID=UPI00396A1768